MRVICLLSSCTLLLRIYEITKVGSPHNFIKVTLLFLLFLVYVSVNVFSAKVLIEDTVFMSPTWRLDCHF